MGYEQIAIVGVAICAAIAFLAFFNTARITRQMKNRPLGRPRRRLVGTPEGAQMAARSIVEELVRNHGPQVEQAKTSGKPDEKLARAIEEARLYFLSRVDARYKPVFHDVLDELVFGRVDCGPGGAVDPLR